MKIFCKAVNYLMFQAYKLKYIKDTFVMRG